MLLITMVFVSLWATVSAQNLEIIPEVKATGMQTVVTDVNKVATPGKVWDNYDNVVAQKRDLSVQLASGIMDWQTILDYAARFIRYLSEIGIFVWAVFIVYAGYIYATAIFQNGKVDKGNTAIKNAILGVVIITFSYAIMKAVMAAFL